MTLRGRPFQADFRCQSFLLGHELVLREHCQRGPLDQQPVQDHGLPEIRTPWSTKGFQSPMFYRLVAMLARSFRLSLMTTSREQHRTASKCFRKCKHSTCQRVGLTITAARNIGKMPTLVGHCLRVITCGLGRPHAGSTQAAAAPSQSFTETRGKATESVVCTAGVECLARHPLPISPSPSLPLLSPMPPTHSTHPQQCRVCALMPTQPTQPSHVRHHRGTGLSPLARTCSTLDDRRFQVTICGSTFCCE